MRQPATLGTWLTTQSLLMLSPRLAGAPLTLAMLDRWIQRGVATPSIHRSPKPGRQHQWAPADAALVAGLARLRAEGVDVLRHGPALKRVWPRLVAALEQPGPLFLTMVGRDAVAVLSKADLVVRLDAHVRTPIIAWPLQPLSVIYEETAALGVELA